jgi:phenylacetic acid degradation operon negative regulatory protein
VQHNTVEALGRQDARPRSLAMSLFWLFGRGQDEVMPISALIRLMDALDTDEAAVRSTISRLKRGGLLEPHSRAGHAGYLLTSMGRDLLRESDQRNFERDRAKAEDGWVTIVFSVPESERSKRHTLRSRLKWLGYGSVSSGVWIAPGTLLDETEDMIRRHGLADYVEFFLGSHRSAHSTETGVSRWWDLQEIESGYTDFIAAFGPVPALADAGLTDRECFAQFVRLMTSWRRLPFVDPGIPADLLPHGWQVDEARELLAKLDSLLRGPAYDHAAQVLSQS